MLSDLYLSSKTDKPPLRIGLLLDTALVSAAVASVLRHIQRSDFVRIEVVVYNSPQDQRNSPHPRNSRIRTMLRTLRNPTQRQRLAWMLYGELDQKFSPIKEDPLSPVDCSDLLRTIESLRVAPITKGFVHRFPPEAVEEIRATRVDVLLRFGFNILRGDILTAARYGIWSFHHGDNDYYRGGPAHFWEMWERNPLLGVILQILGEELDAGRVLIKGIFASESGLSLRRNRVQPYWGSTHFVIQKLWELHHYGWDHIQAKMVPPAPYRGKRKVYRSPKNLEVIRWAVPQLVRKASRAMRRAITRSNEIKHWRIAVRITSRCPLCQTADYDMRGFRWVESPRDHFYADPFLIRNDRKYWVFFEDYNYTEQRGVISCAELSEDGNIGVVTLALDTGKHSSYPYLFCDGREIYMVPETLEHEAVLLYRCVRFPNEWSLEAELFHGRIVDTSVCKHNGMWWFFVTMMEPRGNGMGLYLFFSESLTDKWHYHPANPISLDVRAARGAGAIHTCGGQLIRPTQDCSHCYGYAVDLAEIVKLNRIEYEERPILTLTPSWDPKLLAMHTYNHVDRFEAIDGLTLQNRSCV
jgi:hypothetical protein